MLIFQNKMVDLVDQFPQTCLLLTFYQYAASLFFFRFFFFYSRRIDGTLVNITARIGQKTMLNNGTVVMDIHRTVSSQSDETGVVLISLQYESGLFLFFLFFFFLSVQDSKCQLFL